MKECFWYELHVLTSNNLALDVRPAFPWLECGRCPTLIHPNEWNPTVRRRGGGTNYHSNHLPPELQGSALSTHPLNPINVNVDTNKYEKCFFMLIMTLSLPSIVNDINNSNCVSTQGFQFSQKYILHVLQSCTSHQVKGKVLFFPSERYYYCNT